MQKRAHQFSAFVEYDEISNLIINFTQILLMYVKLAQSSRLCQRLGIKAKNKTNLRVIIQY